MQEKNNPSTPAGVANRGKRNAGTSGGSVASDFPRRGEQTGNAEQRAGASGGSAAGEEPARPSGRLPQLLLLAALVAAIAIVQVTDLGRFLNQEYLRGIMHRVGAPAPLLYMLIYAFAPSLFLPGLPLTILGGVLFGPFWGVVYAITGATAGASLAFLIARYAARGWVEGKLRNPRLRRLDKDVERHGWKVVAFTRLIPLFPFNLLNYAFGLTGIGFLPYAVASFFCMLPACIAYIVFSSSLLDLLQGRISASLLIGAALIVLISLIPWAYRAYRRKKGMPDFL